MSFGDRRIINLVIKPDAVAGTVVGLLSSGADGQVVSRTGVEYSLFTVAVIRAAGLDVSQDETLSLIVPPNRPTEFSWSIVPLKYGDDLTVSISLFVEIGEDMPPLFIQTFHETVDVDVGFGAWMRLAAESTSSVQGIITAIFATLFPTGSNVWTRRDRPIRVLRRRR
jgi:hypothetical protein